MSCGSCAPCAPAPCGRSVNTSAAACGPQAPAGYVQGAQIAQLTRGPRNNGCIPPSGQRDFYSEPTNSESSESFNYVDKHRHTHFRHHNIALQHETQVIDVIHTKLEEGCAQGGVYTAPVQESSIRSGNAARSAQEVVPGYTPGFQPQCGGQGRTSSGWQQQSGGGGCGC